MAARAQIGFVPYRMRVQDAAAYCGDPVSTFLEKVRAGLRPAPVREGRNVYWRSAELVASMEAADLDAVEEPAWLNSFDRIGAR